MPQVGVSEGAYLTLHGSSRFTGLQGFWSFIVFCGVVLKFGLLDFDILIVSIQLLGSLGICGLGALVSGFRSAHCPWRLILSGGCRMWEAEGRPADWHRYVGVSENRGTLT